MEIVVASAYSIASKAEWATIVVNSDKRRIIPPLPPC